MSVYNGEKYLRDAVDSILNQTFSDFEFLIINDASTDNTLKILCEYKDPRVRIMTNEKNLGLTQSLNNGIKIARGEYIARQDSDDLSLPKRFEYQVTFLEKNPHVVALGTSTYIVNDKGLIQKEISRLPSPQYMDLLQDNQFIHGSMVLRKNILLQMNGYNPIFIQCQDYELWLRIVKQNEMRNLSESLYMLREHATNIGVLHWEKSYLFKDFARKIATKQIDQKTINVIEHNGIKELKKYFSFFDKIKFYHFHLYQYWRKIKLIHL